MLRTKSDPDQPCGNPPQQGYVGNESEKKWGGERSVTMQYAADEAFLKEKLESLRHLRR